MPYVTIPAISRANLLVAAERRWTAVRLARPDLEPALALQQRLLTLITELTATLEGGRIPTTVAAAEIPGRQAGARRPGVYWRADSASRAGDASSPARFVRSTGGRRRRPGRGAYPHCYRRRRDRRRFVVERVVQSGPDRDSHRRGPPRPGARPGVADRRARREPVRLSPAADAPWRRSRRRA